MSKNIIKQLQSRIKTHNNKLITSIKFDIEKTYESKQLEIENLHRQKENRIRKAYASFASKIDKFQNVQNREFQEIKEMINKAIEDMKVQENKLSKLNKRMIQIKEDLKCELKKDIEDSNNHKRNVFKDVSGLKSRVEGNLLKIKQDDDISTIKEILTSLM